MYKNFTFPVFSYGVTVEKLQAGKISQSRAKSVLTPNSWIIVSTVILSYSLDANIIMNESVYFITPIMFI